MARFKYDVESFGLADVHSGHDLESAIRRLLNDRDAAGWEFVESHPSPDEPSTRLFVFRREVDTGQVGIWEITWEGRDARATFEYGTAVIEGKRHVIWRRIGSHEIFGTP
jgi:hypothetical protein